MNAVTKSTALVLSDVHVPAPARERGIEPHAWNALKNSVYKGASDNMILLAVDYCKAKKLDPLMKPVHIVKTWDPDANGMIEGIWPGINLHRTNGARTGAYAGQDRPVFGPIVEKQLGARKFSFPEWCEVTVYRMISGQRVAYTGLVYFEETFAAGKDKGPNRMWTKRPRGQLAKCAEAEALRKAFPEENGGEPTAEEMGAGEPGDHARDVTPTAEQPARVATRMDALESAIDAETTENPGGVPTTGKDLSPETTGAAGVYDVETGEVLGAAQTEEQTRAEVWGNEAIRRIDRAMDATVIDAWIAKNQARLAEIHAVAPDVSIAVLGAADARKKALGGSLDI